MATLKTPEQYIERNISTFTERADKNKEFGTSYVQRVCRIGYNQAVKTIETMLERNLISQAEPLAWTYVFNEQD